MIFNNSMQKNILYIFLFVFIFSFAQQKKDTVVNQLDEIVLLSKSPKKFLKSPNQVEVINAKQIEFQNFQNTADLLANSGSLFVQKSQQGAGSPSIRGFEASRVLMVVDGVRMNNLIFRSGHLQNIITVDESILDKVAIYYGPSSTLFGSDALGGTVSMTTKNAKFFNEVNEKISGSINTRYGSVNEEKSAAFQLNYALDHFASLTSISFNDFGDLKMGKRKNPNGDFFGERLFYIETINGTDVLTSNPNRFIQINSAYKQYNLMQKLAYKTNSGFEHGLNFQFSTSSNIPRYDRLTDATSTGLRNAEWYYGPQKRILAIYSLNKNKALFSSDMKLNFAYQNVKESRHNRRFGNYNLQNREENVTLFSTSLDLNRKFKKGELFYGLESYYEVVKSTAFSQNINSGIISNLDTRYPNGDNFMIRNDLYVSYNEKVSNKTFWNLGARIGYTSLKSTIADDAFFPLPFSTISQGNITYSGTAGIVFKTTDNVFFKANLSTGFRVPNVDDLAKVFESVAGTVIVPNKDLNPEKTLTGDVGFVIESKSKKVKFENTYFYTKLYDAIVTKEFTYNGQSSLDYLGSSSQVFANQNSGKAFVTGLSTNFNAVIVKDLKFSVSFNYSLGRVVEEEGHKPLDHIAPYYGKIGFLYNFNLATFEAYLLYNGKKRLSDYSTSGEDNLVYAPQNGMPAWETYNFKSSFKIFNNAVLFAGAENILDIQYRTFSSGINAPGRNLYLGLNYGF